MNCPACAHANRPGAKFCEECAAPLPRACASCGAELRPTAKFCDECGTPVASKAAPGAASAGASGQRASEARSEAESAKPSEAERGSRKIVTIIFADLVGSTALHERLDAESVRRFMESYYAAMRGAVDAHGGRVTQVMGDGVKAVFGAPRVAEDDALRAVRAGVEMQRAFGELAQREAGLVGETGIRVAVNTGEVVADDASEIIGDPVNVAARLQEKGAIGDVVIGGETQRIVAAQVTLALLGTFALKGRSEPVKAYRVESLEPPARETTAAFVGRDEELARLTAVYETACTKPATQLAVLLGSPGLGKSRLIDEFTRRLGDGASVMSAHCDAAGGATFAPLARALREGLGIEESASGDTLRDAIANVLPAEDAESARIARSITALLTGSPAPPEETFFVVRRLLATLAAARPVLLVIDDLQWGEPLLLDLVEHLVQWGSGTRLLVLVGARPELRDARSSIATPGGLVADVITLAGLDAFAATRLAANVIGAADLPTAIAAKLLTTSEGNPLFVGALVRMLVDEGALRREGERWVASAELAQLEMPPTIHALLAARIERLRPEERGVLERAAVVGRHFSRSAVAALLGPRESAELDARLEALRRAELIERDPGWWLGEPALRFHHVLIRDAAYRRVLKGTRAELHARLADWIEERAGESTEHDETIGWHLEQAHEHLRELGPLDARGMELGARAAQRLAAAGRRALARDDVALAGSLLRRALERLAPESADRPALALDCAEALLASGEVAPAAGVIEELGRLANDERLRAWHTCFTSQLSVLREPQGLAAAASAVASAADALAKLGDVAGEAKAHHVHAQALARLGRVGAAEAALDHALAAARRAEDRRRSNAVLAGAPLTVLWGPNPVTRASGRCLDVVRVLRITQGAPAVEAVALSCQGVLEALRGRTDAARRMVASARKLVEELGVTRRVLEVDVMAARIDLIEGDPAAAEKLLRGAADGLRALGLGSDAAQALALLGRAALAQGRASEAEALSRESEALAGDDLQAAIAWHGVRAEALSQRGDRAAAHALAQAAVEIASATDALLDHAQARLAFARVLRAAGRNNEASAEEKRAIELLEAKGATLLVERVRSGAPRDARAHEPAPMPAPRAGAPTRARVRENAATASARRLEVAIRERDEHALASFFAPGFTNLHHPTGVALDARMPLDFWSSLLRSRAGSMRNEPLATLGDSIGLFRHTRTLSALQDAGIDVAAADTDEIVLFEADAEGRGTRAEIFAADRLADAIARLYAWYAESLPEGTERTRAEATARSVAAVVLSTDPDRLAPALDPSVWIADNRVLHTWSCRGAEEYQRQFRRQRELAPDFAVRDDDVLALEPRALLVRQMYGGTNSGGGAFENHILALYAFGADGRVTSAEVWEPGLEADALARFDELTARALPQETEHPFANAAWRGLRASEQAWNARDWPALRATYHDAHAMDDRRKLMRLVIRGDAFFANERGLFDDSPSVWGAELIATRGERLALARVHFVARVEGGGPAEVEMLEVVEVDAGGRRAALVVFDCDDETAAYAELDARFEAGEGAAQPAANASRAFRNALGSRDWEALARLLAADFALHDHRTLGFGDAAGVARYVDLQRALAELSPDVTLRVDHLRMHPGGFLWHATHSGTREGGAFETPFVAAAEIDALGLVRRVDAFAPERLAELLARFDALRAANAEPEPPFANSATRAWRELMGAWVARDVARWKDVQHALVRYRDHRPLMQLDYDRAQLFEFARPLLEMRNAAASLHTLATRGERLALERLTIEMADAEIGASAIESLMLIETNAAGAITEYQRWDAGDLDTAYGELEARWDAQASGPREREWAAAMTQAIRLINDRHWGEVLATCAPEVVRRDHRIMGMPPAHGPRAFVDAMRVLAELSPDASLHVDHRRRAGRGELRQISWRGTRDGGAFELAMLGVSEWDERGRHLCLDLYDLEDFDRARARFEQIVASTASAPAASPSRFENAASRAWREVMEAWLARDVARFEQLQHALLRARDHRRLMQLDHDREQYLAFTRPLLEMRSAGTLLELLATRGERLALIHFSLQIADDAVGPSVIESLALVETNAAGAITEYQRWDPEDRDAAYAELDARYEAGEASAHPLAAAWSAEYLRSFAARDWAALERLAAHSEIARNHRLVGWGTLRGPTWVHTLKALVELSPDVHERIEHVRTSERALFWSSVRRGTREGGSFETPWLFVVQLDAEGRETQLDVWDAESLLAALARFEALHVVPASTRDPFANFATRAAERGAVAISARDWEGFAAELAPQFAYIDRTAIGGFETTREAWLAAFRAQVEMTSEPLAPRVLATRGERLALVQIVWRGARGDIGVSEIDWLLIIEANAAGQHVAVVNCNPSDPAAAYAELDARFDAGEGTEHPRALSFLRTFMNAVEARDWDAVDACFRPGFEYRDRRVLGFGALPGSSMAPLLKTLVDLAPDVRSRIDHACLCERGVLHQVSQLGTHDGGTFERAFLALFELDAQGQAIRGANFDVAQVEEARARFEEIAARGAAPSSPEPFANVASRADSEFLRCFNTRDWPGALGCISPTLAFDERRSLLRNTANREQMLAQLRFLFDTPASRFTTRLLATRGERLSLHRHEFDALAAEGGGPLASDPHLALQEVDASGRITATVLFDLADEAAAHAELDARFAAGEGALPANRAREAFVRAVSVRDWGSLAALCTPRFFERDHRRLTVLRPENSAAQWIQNLRSVFELAPDTLLRFDHARCSARGFLWQVTWTGTRDGGRYEIPLVGVFEVDAEGRLASADTWEPEGIAQAFARFEELGREAAQRARDPLAIPPNAATRTMDRWFAGTASGDMDAVRAIYAESYALEDRRTLNRGVFDLDAAVENARFLSEGWRWKRTLLATAGERLALWHIMFKHGEAGGVSELEIVELDEVDGDGRVVRIVLFDPDARATAHAELFERYVSLGADGMPAAQIEMFRAFAARDPARMRAALPDAYYVDDRRALRLGRVDRDVYVASFTALNDLSRELRADELYQVAVAPSARLSVSRMSGANTEGGEFETFAVWLSRYENGEFASSEYYDLEDLDVARARFEEFGRGAPPPARDPLAIPPNAATRLWDRWYAAVLAGEDGRGIFSESYQCEDRRQVLRGAYSLDSALSFARWVREGGWRATRTLLAATGDRLALLRVVWRSRASGSESEIEWLELEEASADGRSAAAVLFDPSARAAAHEEMFQRNLRLGGQGVPPAVLELVRAINSRDMAALRAALCDDFVAQDHRRFGFGTMEGAEAYVDSVRAYQALTPDARLDALYAAVTSERGGVVVIRTFGTNLEGGAFDTMHVAMSLVRDGRVARVENYDVEDLAAALARFEELTRGASQPARDPLAIPPNAAAHLYARLSQAFAAEDWDAHRAVASADFRFEDRTKRGLVSGDVETWIRAARFFRAEAGAGIETRVLATHGERIALYAFVLRGGRIGHSFEIEGVRLIEIDAEGKLRAFMRFDAEDRAAAFDEAEARFAAGEGAEIGHRAPLAAMSRAMATQDWAAFRELLTPDFEMHDLRTLGHGVLTRDAWIDSNRTLAGLGSGVHIEHLQLLAWNRRGRVSIVRTAGLNESGGEFEILAIGLLLTEGDRVARMERYDLADAPRALARFEELTRGARDPLVIAPNAATLAADRQWALARSRDWEGLRAIYAPGFTFDDRRRLVRTRGDIEVLLASLRTFRWETVALERSLIATAGDRLALERRRWRGQVGDTGDFESESLTLTEVDAEGRITAIVLFDVEDRPEAFEEARARFVGGEAAAIGGQRAAAVMNRALAAGDWAAFANSLTEDFVMRDLRTLGYGELGRDRHVESVRALAGLGSRVRVEQLQLLAWNRHGSVAVVRTAGVNEAGGDFEVLAVGVTIVSGDRVALIERYDLADAGPALARFEALCAERERAEAERK